MKYIHNLSRAPYVILASGLVSNRVYAFTIPPPTQATAFSDVVLAIADLMMKIGIPAAAIFLVYAGFLFVTARGNETQLATAKKIFMWTVLGTAIIVGAKYIASAVVNFAKNLN